MAKTTTSGENSLDRLKEAMEQANANTSDPGIKSGIANAYRAMERNIARDAQNATEATAVIEESILATTADTPIAANTSPLLFGATGFILGTVLTLLICRMKIKKIKSECETRVNEARASLDRMISHLAKE